MKKIGSYLKQKQLRKICLTGFVLLVSVVSCFTLLHFLATRRPMAEFLYSLECSDEMVFGYAIGVWGWLLFQSISWGVRFALAVHDFSHKSSQQKYVQVA